MDTWRDIRLKAREARAILGPAADAPARSTLDAMLRRWDVVVDAVAPDHPLLRGARAAWREDYGLALVDRTLTEPERLFAIAHELGHRACHSGDDVCSDGDIDDAASPTALPLGEGRVWGYNPRQVRELEANIFAAELLAPASELRARFMAGQGYQALAKRYGVTPTCILNSLLGAVLGGAELPSAPLIEEKVRESLPSGNGEESWGWGRRGRVAPASPPSPYSTNPFRAGQGVNGALDGSQRRAAESAAPRALVDAGPGTGKTRTLVARVLYLVQERLVPARDILILTFSNGACDELRARLREAGPQTDGVTVSTFHGFALDALRRFAPQAGLPDGFRVVDDVDAAIMLEETLPRLDLQHYRRLARPTLYLPPLLDAASRARDQLLAPRDIEAHIDDYARDNGASDEERAKLDETLRLLVAYDATLRERGLVDYGGLISHTVDLLRSDRAVAAAIRGGLRHVLVDEYQDVNRASAVLLRELVGDGAWLWVVGDVRQSIYRFRGAEPGNLDDFERDFPGALRLSLDVNYRAAPGLVAAIGAIATTMSGLPTAWRAEQTVGTDDGGVTMAVAADGAAERAGVVADISRSIAGGRRPEDHAVLCRTHRQASEMAAALEGAGLATSYLGALFLRPEVKSLLSLLELCHGFDGAALLRLATWPEYRLEQQSVAALIARAHDQGVPFPAALGDPRVTAILSVEERTAIARLAAHIDAVRYYSDPASILLRYLCGDAPYLRRLLRDDSPRSRQAVAAIFQLIVLARGFAARPLTAPSGNPTLSFLRYVRRLLAEGDTGVAQAAAQIRGAVNVLTIHASKGLEFPIVYLPNLAKGRFPPRARGGVAVALPPALRRDSQSDLAEEDNLFFVAASRARERLVLSRAQRYGGRAAEASPLLGLLEGLHGINEVSWPALGEDESERRTPARDEAIAAMDSAATRRATAGARDLAAAVRCPSLYRYQAHLGLRGDEGAPGFRQFSRLLRADVARLRAARGTPDWPPSWSVAATQFAARWDESWPPDTALSRWYRDAALGALQRVYEDAQGEQEPSTSRRQYGQEYTVDLDGHDVVVPVDVVEEGDGDTRLVCELPTRRNDDTTSQIVALYAAVARRIAPEGGVHVAIRYLDSGETQPIANPERVLAKHQPRLREALDRLARDDYPSAPRDDDECLRCPLVFACPR